VSLHKKSTEPIVTRGDELGNGSPPQPSEQVALALERDGRMRMGRPFANELATLRVTDAGHSEDCSHPEWFDELEARRHKVGNNLYRRDEADAADCAACPLREKCLQSAETRCKHLAVFVEPAHATLSQQMIAKIDTLEARESYGQRLAIVEPVFGNIRSQKRLDRFTLRGKIKVNIQWTLYCIVHNIEKIVNYGLAV